MNQLIMEYHGLRKIISGGQDGVDLGALKAAKAWPVTTGGWAPSGYRTCHGNDPSLATYGLLEHISKDYPPRTALNVREADGTLVIASNMNSAGTLLTIRLCVKYCKPFHVIELPKVGLGGLLKAVKWVKEAEVEVLNVAGNHRQPEYHEAHTIDIVNYILTELTADGLVKKAV